MSVRKVVLGISGGVDSAVAGLLLKKKSYNVTGVFMRNWDSTDELGYCSSDKEAEDAESICKKLNIPFHKVNFVQEYWNEVFSYLLEEYQKGRTPNPDIYCNRFLKFSHFFSYALREFGADAIATGHYAKSSFGPFLEYYQPNDGARLLKAYDEFKDQTFFLSQVPQYALRRTMFPIGNMKKESVRKLAFENGLDEVAMKEDSTGICFIGKRKFSSFISQYVKDKPGDFIDIDSGEKVGEHRGLHHWTIGQRARIEGFSWKYYICKKDLNNNQIYVAKGGNHYSFYADSLIVESFQWVNGIPKDLISHKKLYGQFRFQHTKPLIDCTVERLDLSDAHKISYMGNHSVVSSSCDTSDLSSLYLVKLDQPLRALTPGQFAVIYRGDECLGAASIITAGPSLHDRLQFWKENGKLFCEL